MTVDFDTWLGRDEAITAERRAIAAWSRIQDKPTSITIKRLGTAQTVRIEYSETGNQANSPAGQGAVRGVVVFGIRDHPTLDDTNIRANDRFVLNGVEYTVLDVVRTIGEVQARAERVA